MLNENASPATGQQPLDLPSSARRDIVSSNHKKELCVEFYNMKLKRKIDVPESQIKKTVFQQKGAAGGAGQRRYALTAEHEGTRMFKFVSEATYTSMKVPEAS